MFMSLLFLLFAGSLAGPLSLPLFLYVPHPVVTMQPSKFRLRSCLYGMITNAGLTRLKDARPAPGEGAPGPIAVAGPGPTAAGYDGLSSYHHEPVCFGVVIYIYIYICVCVVYVQVLHLLIQIHTGVCIYIYIQGYIVLYTECTYIYIYIYIYTYI